MLEREEMWVRLEMDAGKMLCQFLSSPFREMLSRVGASKIATMHSRGSRRAQQEHRAKQAAVDVPK